MLPQIAAKLLVCAVCCAGATAAATVKVEIAEQPLATTSDHFTCASALVTWQFFDLYCCFSLWRRIAAPNLPVTLKSCCMGETV